MDILKADRWDMRLWRSGVFSFRYFSGEEHICPETGEVCYGFRTAQHEKLAECFGAVVGFIPRDLLLEVHDAFDAAREHIPLAAQWRREYLAKLAAARAAVLAKRQDIDVQAALAELRHLSKGGAA